MREIKFRAWDKQHNCFTKYPFVVDQNGLVFREYVGGGKVEKHYSLQQYTGLKDKNGKEIYEGDVVLRRDTADGYKERWGTKKYTIFYDSEQAKYRFKEEADVWGLIWKMEVIGNIYENPDLLTTDKQQEI